MTTRSRLAGFFARYLALESDRERASHALVFVLRMLIVVAGLVALISAAAGLKTAAILAGIGAVVMVLLRLLMLAGYPRVASVLLILTWQAIATVALVTGDGIHDIATIIFPAVLITASLLMDRRLFVAMAAVSVAAITAVGSAEVLGWIRTPFSEPERWGDVANIAVILACIALLVRFLTEALRFSLDRARRNEERFRGVFNATSEAIIIHDAATGAIVDVNESFLEMTGSVREQALATPPERFYGRAVSWQLIGQPGRDELEVLECDLPAGDGGATRVEVTFRRTSIGGRPRVLAVARDITERWRLEDRLRQSEKMQAVGELAGGIAHDFNNQLVGIVGYADILRTKLVDRPDVRTYAENILRSARRASDLTAHLLAFARKGKFLTATVDLHELITEVVELLERSIDKRIEITLELGARPATTVGDPSQLQNCFLNLALNARDAMPAGGTLSFSTAIVELDDELCRSNRFDVGPGDYVEVTVADSGIGMSRRVMSRIFEPFFTTKGKERGTGMGLAAVYGTVKNHRGAIGVESEEGRGTVFKVLLPLSRSAADHGAAEPDDEPHLDWSGAHVLLVDDEDAVCDTTAEMLRALGCRVTVCRNGRDAVELFREAATDIDLVVLDMIMPIMGGGATFDRLVAIDPSVRVLLSSGYTLDGEAQEMLDRGARGFVQKPFLKGELSRAVREALTADL